MLSCARPRRAYSLEPANAYGGISTRRLLAVQKAFEEGSDRTPSGDDGDLRPFWDVHYVPYPKLASTLLLALAVDSDRHFPQHRLRLAAARRHIDRFEQLAEGDGLGLELEGLLLGH